MGAVRQMTRRDSLKLMLQGIGLFTILPGAGRIWKAERKVEYITLDHVRCEAMCFNDPFWDYLRRSLEGEAPTMNPVVHVILQDSTCP